MLTAYFWGAGIMCDLNVPIFVLSPIFKVSVLKIAFILRKLHVIKAKATERLKAKFCLSHCEREAESQVFLTESVGEINPVLLKSLNDQQ